MGARRRDFPSSLPCSGVTKVMPAGKYTIATPVVEVEEAGKTMKVELFQLLGAG